MNLHKIYDEKHTYFLEDMAGKSKLVNAYLQSNWKSSPLAKSELFGLVDLGSSGGYGIYVSKDGMLISEGGWLFMCTIFFRMVEQAWVETAGKKQVLCIKGYDGKIVRYKRQSLSVVTKVSYQIVADMLNDIAAIYNLQ